ncbi:diacylglycerol kinase family protein [Nitrosomonas eutropha]|nr:diacylglycerol kinase family protein [Nitrosomonas eutropha]PXV79768.1 diacylglycerol kinase family enzyme [Nitrosomonas eutropha]SCX25602.1 Diacylglycerol kinase family enzyme [Nitrosomonas eutropha]SEI38702.1 Diacylglycerol kinase family enzyme [Nitrosomonas eutropha]
MTSNSVGDFVSARVGLIYNPLGGWFRKHAAQMQSLLATLPEIRQIQATSPVEFEQAVIAIIEAKIEWLVVVGGDGTLQGVISCLFERLSLDRWPEITIVPAGTTNMTALDLGTNGRAEQILTRIRQYVHQPGEVKRIKRPVLRIEQAGTRNVYGMIFGLGLIARGVKFSHSQIKHMGITGNIFTVLIVLRSLVGSFLGRPQTEWAPVHITQEDNTGTLSEKVYLFALVSTLERLLLGIRPYWGQEPAPLRTTFVEQHSKHFWRNIWPLIAGRGHHLKREEGYISYNAASVELWLDDEYIVDGELYHASSQYGPVKITADGPILFRVF